MKFIHIADLHIGIRVNEFSMLEDQKYILGQILQIVQREHADAVLIAGDVYDKALPSAESVQIFDRFLTELADGKKKVFVVSGNHDSPERLAFGARLMSGRGVHMSPVYEGDVKEITLEDEFGEIGVWMLPFLKPATVRHALEGKVEGNMPETYAEAVKMAVDRMKIDDTKRNILVAHQFVAGAGTCDSEIVSVGSLDNVPVDIFDGFDYVAMGHLHNSQSVRRDTLRYCGTPLKYSFSEADQVKSVTVVEMREKGQVSVLAVPLVPLHDMRKIRGTYLEVTAKSFYQEFQREDYVQVTLTDEEDVPDGLQKLRIIYPNLMRLSYDNTRTGRTGKVDADSAVEQKSEEELFGEFYELQNNQPMGEEQRAYMKKVIESLQTP